MVAERRVISRKAASQVVSEFGLPREGAFLGAQPILVAECGVSARETRLAICLKLFNCLGGQRIHP
jgi:hypothetical protein